MSKRASAIIWLVVGLVFGVITLVSCGVSGYFTWHTQGKASAAEKVYNEEDAELSQLEKKKHRSDGEEKRFDELNARDRREKVAKDVNEWRGKRQYSLVALVACLIPLLISLRGLFVFGMRMLRKDNDDKEEDRPRKKKKATQDEEKPPPAKTKKKKTDDKDGRYFER